MQSTGNITVARQWVWDCPCMEDGKLAACQFCNPTKPKTKASSLIIPNKMIRPNRPVKPCEQASARESRVSFFLLLAGPAKLFFVFCFFFCFFVFVFCLLFFWCFFGFCLLFFVFVILFVLFFICFFLLFFVARFFLLGLVLCCFFEPPQVFCLRYCFQYLQQDKIGYDGHSLELVRQWRQKNNKVFLWFLLHSSWR